MDWMDEVVRRRERACVTAAAVHLVMVAREDPETRAAVDVALAVRTACRSCGRCARSGTRRRRASTARTSWPPTARARPRTGTTMFLYGGRSDEALEELTQALLARYPGLQIVGGWSPPFRPLTETSATSRRAHQRVRRRPRLGRHWPAQAGKWMAAMRDRLDAAVLRRRRRVRLPRRDRAPGAALAAAPRPRVDVPPGGRAPAPVAALPAQQPPLRRRVRAPVRRAPRRALTRRASPAPEVHVALSLLTPFPGRSGGTETYARALVREFGRGAAHSDRVAVLASRQVAETLARTPAHRSTSCGPTAQGDSAPTRLAAMTFAGVAPPARSRDGRQASTSSTTR